MAKHSANILEWARRGAEARWQQLQEEIASLVQTFPHLGTTKAGPGRRRQNGALGASGDSGTAVTGRARGERAAVEAGTETRARKRSKMTASQKRAVSLRMKKYWADRRKAAGKA